MTNNNTVWVVDDERSIRWVMDRALSQEGFDVTCFDDAESMLQALDRQAPDAIVSDIRMPGISGLDLLERVKTALPDLPVIIMTAHSDLDSAVSSLQGGAFEYLPKPFEVDEAVSVVRRALLHAGSLGAGSNAAAEAAEPAAAAEIIGKAPAMQEVFRAIGRLSRSSVSVLINGQSGTGKELVARALHRHSPRASGIFVPLNMAAIPGELVESELFGHEKGAFTGANHLHRGKFELAQGGTLFLDEIGDMPAASQTRLLRVLSDGEFYRVGGHEPLKADVRIIAATHQNLEDLVSRNEFRDDLFHRLNVIRIHIPTLDQRREDIPLLTEYFLAAAAEELNEETKVLHPGTLQYLCDAPWPGNVRQLENLCKWITVMASGREVLLGDLPPEMREAKPEGESGDNWEKSFRRWATVRLGQGDAGQEGLLTHATRRFERILIQTALKHTGGRKRDAAILLGWGRNTLTRKIRELSLEAEILEE